MSHASRTAARFEKKVQVCGFTMAEIETMIVMNVKELMD